MYASWKQPIQLSRMAPCIDMKGNKSSRRVTWRASADQLKPVLYGIKKTEKWPAKGCHKVMYDGIIFWVNPLGKLKERDPDAHWRSWYKPKREGPHSRLRCQCPICYKEVSYGRLHQHLKVHSCPKCGEVYNPDFASLSRVDNKTVICGPCGTKEALDGHL